MGGGPAVEEANDVTSAAADDAGGGVSDLPAEPIRLGSGEGTGDTEQLKRGSRRVGTHHYPPGHPAGIIIRSIVRSRRAGIPTAPTVR